METQEAKEFIYLERGIWNEQTKEPEKPPIPKVHTDKPRQLARLQELLNRTQGADEGNLRSNSTPSQNTRSKTTQERPIKQLCEVRTTTGPHQNDQCSPQQGHWRPEGNAATPTQPKVLQPMGKSYTKELRQLAQGIPGTKGMDTIVLIKYNKIPLNQRRNVMYGRTVVAY